MLLVEDLKILNCNLRVKITLAQDKQAYETMKTQMKAFYENARNEMRATKLVNDNVYVVKRSEDSSFLRVRLVGIINDEVRQ